MYKQACAVQDRLVKSLLYIVLDEAGPRDVCVFVSSSLYILHALACSLPHFLR